MTATNPTTTTPPADVPMPAGARADLWLRGQYRVIFRDRHLKLEGDPLKSPSVCITAVQWADGTVGDGSTEEGPAVHVHCFGDDGLTPAQARELAAMIVEAADELDRWVTR